jgi:hypothetical protein
MPRRASRRRIGEQRRTPQAKKGNRRPGKVVTIPYPLDPDVATWEVELLGVGKGAFLALWQSGGDRIGFSVADRLIYDKAQPIARILRKVRRPRSAGGEEE